MEKAEEIKESDVINGVAAFCANFISNSQVLESQLKDWLSTGQGGCIQSIGLRRALLAAFSERKGEHLLFCKTKRSLTNYFRLTHGIIQEKPIEFWGQILHQTYLASIPGRFVRCTPNMTSNSADFF